MATCPNCGSVIPDSAAFCSVCGSPIAHAGPPPPPRGTGSAAMTSNVAGAFCYLLWIVTGIVFLVVEPYNRDRFVRFHAFQSILLFVALILFRFIWYSIIMVMFPIGLWGFFSVIGGLITLGFFLLWLFLMYKAYNNERFMIPVIGEIAARQANR